MKLIYRPKKSNAKKGSKLYLLGLIPIILFVSFSVVINIYITPYQIINLVGVNNAYLLIFCLAFLGGLSTFSSVPYHLVVISMAVGGLNPFLLGFTAAAGVMSGDSTSYYLGHRGSLIIPTHFQKFFQKIHKLITSHPKMFPLFCLLYGTFIPFSNDFITITAGLMRYPFWRVIIPLGLGNLMFNIFIAFMATRAYSLLQGIYY